ncbi:MAG: hypothetical protein DIJKHBIC_04791 [Thermoanaerobaculia bacterium]|nr:hypothetical protein [Thermoanaerobaculia bacterium]
MGAKRVGLAAALAWESRAAGRAERALRWREVLRDVPAAVRRRLCRRSSTDPVQRVAMTVFPLMITRAMS